MQGIGLRIFGGSEPPPYENRPSSLPLLRPRCHNLPADIVVPRRSIALSLNSLSLGYRRAKTRPRRVLCLLTFAQ